MIINNRNKWDVLYSDNSIHKSMKIWCSVEDNHQGAANKALEKLREEGFYDVVILAVALASKVYHVSFFKAQGTEWKEEYEDLESAFIAASKAASENTENEDEWCEAYLEEAELWFSSMNQMMNGNQKLEEVKNQNYSWD